MKPVIAICFVLAGLAVKGQQLPNSGFEKWSIREEYIEPDGWISTNAFAYFGAPETCYPIENAHTGKWAMKLEARIDPITGDTLQAVLAVGSDYQYAGIAFTHRPQSFSFYYQHNRRDTAVAAVFLTKWNTLKNKRDTLATAFTFFIDSTTTYTKRTLPFNWVSQTSPDTCIAVFLASLKPKPNPGNYLIIDDLMLDGFLGTEDIFSPKNQLTVYPNPVTERLYIETDREIISAEILSITGERILTASGNEITTSSLLPGIYILLLKDVKGELIHRKFIKK